LHFIRVHHHHHHHRSCGDVIRIAITIAIILIAFFHFPVVRVFHFAVAPVRFSPFRSAPPRTVHAACIGGIHFLSVHSFSLLSSLFSLSLSLSLFFPFSPFLALLLCVVGSAKGEREEGGCEDKAKRKEKKIREKETTTSVFPFFSPHLIG